MARDSHAGSESVLPATSGTGSERLDHSLTVTSTVQGTSVLCVMVLLWSVTFSSRNQTAQLQASTWYRPAACHLCNTLAASSGAKLPRSTSTSARAAATSAGILSADPATCTHAPDHRGGGRRRGQLSCFHGRHGTGRTCARAGAGPDPATTMQNLLLPHASPTSVQGFPHCNGRLPDSVLDVDFVVLVT